MNLGVLSALCGYCVRRPARGPLVVAGRRVIEVGDAHAGLVDQLRDPRHLVELDLRHLVGVGVVVGVQAGREEDDRDAFRGVAVVIAPVVDLFQIGRIVELVAERQRLRQLAVGGAIQVVQLRADPIGPHQIDRVRLARLVVAVAADHVDVQLRDDPLHRDRRVVREVARAEQAVLFADVPDEQQRSLRTRDRRRTSWPAPSAPRSPIRRRPLRSRCDRLPRPSSRGRAHRRAARRSRPA